MSIEIRQEGFTASCDSCGRPWRAHEVREDEGSIRSGINSDDWETDAMEAYCPRCCGEDVLNKRLEILERIAHEAARGHVHETDGCALCEALSDYAEHLDKRDKEP